MKLHGPTPDDRDDLDGEIRATISNVFAQVMDGAPEAPDRETILRRGARGSSSSVASATGEARPEAPAARDARPSQAKNR